MQITAVMKAGEEIGQAAAQQPRAVHRVLDAYRRHQPQVREEIARQVLGKAKRVAAREHQHSLEPSLAAQRNQREAAARSESRYQQFMVSAVVGAEPGTLEVDELRGDRHEGVDEAHPRRLLYGLRAAGEEVADLVLRVVEDERDFLELVGGAQAHDEAIEELSDRTGAQQLELPFLRLAQE